MPDSSHPSGSHHRPAHSGADAEPRDGVQDEPEEKLAEASLMSHLLELRSRFLKAGGAVILVFICLVPFAQRIFEAVARPLMAQLPAGPP